MRAKDWRIAWDKSNPSERLDAVALIADWAEECGYFREARLLRIRVKKWRTIVAKMKYTHSIFHHRIRANLERMCSEVRLQGGVPNYTLHETSWPDMEHEDELMRSYTRRLLAQLQNLEGD